MSAPHADGSGYFLYHSIGMFPGKAERVAAALAHVARLWGTPDDAQWSASLAIRNEFIERWRTLLSAPSGTVTTADNVTTALGSVIGALPDQDLKGRKVLIAADCFPSLHFLLTGMAERRGFTVHTVAPRAGESWVRDEDFMAAWGADVGLALVTWVTSTSSHRSDLTELVCHGWKHGSLIGVDITQGIGILPLDVADADADFVIGSSLKWLGGVAGAGVLQVRQGLLPECRPELRGWFSQDNPFSWALDAFDYAPDARRFDHGTPSILPFAACLPALEWHAQQDPAALLAHNRALCEAVIPGCEALGLTLASPRAARERGGSVMFHLPAGAEPRALVAALAADGVFTDVRGATLRISPGNLTDSAGVERLLRGIAGAL